MNERKKNIDEQRLFTEGDEQKQTSQPDDKRSTENEIEEFLFPKVKPYFERIKDNRFDFQVVFS